MKVKTEVCEICRKENCSGNIFWGYDELNDKIHWFCESSTVFKIRPDIYSKAVKLNEEDYPEMTINCYSSTSPAYIIKTCEQLGLNFVPVARFYKTPHSQKLLIAMKRIWKNSNCAESSGFENLKVTFSQLEETQIYNNCVKKIEDIGKD